VARESGRIRGHQPAAQLPGLDGSVPGCGQSDGRCPTLCPLPYNLVLFKIVWRAPNPRCSIASSLPCRWLRWPSC